MPEMRHADAFLDPGVVRAYRHRPPYPESLIERLAGLASASNGIVLELGCGTGELARRLAPRVTSVEAVDPSAAMIVAGRAERGGNAANLAWTTSTAEAYAYASCYALMICAESLHWMDRSAIYARAREHLAPDGAFAIVGRIEKAPWDDEFRALIPVYSLHQDWSPVSRDDLLGFGALSVVEEFATPFAPHRTTVDDYVELQHSRAAFARHRMTPGRAEEFDAAVRRMLAPHASDGSIEYGAAANVIWGRPA